MLLLVDAAGLGKILDDLADRLAAEASAGPPTVLVGIRTRGVPLAQRLATRLETRLGRRLPVGQLDITLYRDDLTRRGPWPLVRGTDIRFAVDQTRVVLIDDVLYTGRTVHAAMVAVLELGRPTLLRLAVLVDRGGREFPIQADWAGMRRELPPGQRVAVRLTEIDGVDEILSQ
jgi:pyrimidine operon attenuation protein/uracil phosphoribosyltransferase